MKNIKPTYFLITALLLFIGEVPGQVTKRVLFIGNSYTLVNNLPLIVYNIAAAHGNTLIAGSNTPGGYTFQQHSTDSITLAKIAQGNWDYVILQEQSQIPAFSPGQVATDCLPYAHQLDSLIHLADSCSETIFYMTWGRKNGDASNCAFYPPICTYAGMQGSLRNSYLTMAQQNNAIVAPAGCAWREVISQAPTFDLYAADESHPSVYGSYLTGCVFYNMLFQQKVVSTSYTAGISISDATLLQQAANSIVFDSIQQWAGNGKLTWPYFNFTQNGTNFQFNNALVNNNNYQWDFGDGNSAAQINPQHNYTNNGTYPVSLTVNNNCRQAVYIDTINITSVGTMGINNYDKIKLWYDDFNKEIKVTSNQNSTLYHIQLFNNLGQLVLKETFTNSVKPNLSDGLYYYDIIDSDLKMYQKSKIMITH